ncbi:NAD(P)H-hydrate dehydratase [Thiohalorhabdus sp.]|uniref:NAD(P)H-hydrate dehydratase n=1 Tax=Thiohalorhabdus sp. TaxID=3094134 RepID=UPI002FC3D500
MKPQKAPFSLFTAAETRALDGAAIAAGIPGKVLMERAGEVTVATLCAGWPSHCRGRIAVLAGGGNNGGDGYVVARRLREAGAAVVLVAVADPERLEADAADAAGRWHQAGGQTVSWEAAPDLKDFDLLVDALLGTGLSSKVHTPYHEAIAAMAAASAPVVAVDIPSGLDADSGRVLGIAPTADLTVTFVGRKRGLFTADAGDVTGEVVFDDLGIPESVYADHPAAGRLLDRSEMALSARPANCHKGDFGRLVLAGGTSGMTGALALAGWAALRAGVGWAVACADPEAQATVAGFHPELITAPWREDGGLPGELVAGANAVAVGPGLGTSSAGHRVLAEAVAGPVPLVVDADGLNLLAEDGELRLALAQRYEATVITPHPGEAARLLGTDAGRIQDDRFAAAQRIAADLGAVCCLKGAGAVIATPEGSFAVSPTGNPGMAMGGQGDVLTGLVAARLAQGDPAGRAVELAVWAHGAAADRLAIQKGPFGFTPGECADALPPVWAELTVDPHP